MISNIKKDLLEIDQGSHESNLGSPDEKDEKDENDTLDNTLSSSFLSMPLRDIVVFPNVISTILVGRQKSINAVEECKLRNKKIFVVTQTDPDHEEFIETNLYKVGVLCTIIESIKTPDGSLKVIIQGVEKAKLLSTKEDDKFYKCEIEPIYNNSFESENSEQIIILKSCIENFTKYAEYNKRINNELINLVTKVKSPFEVVYLIISYLNIAIEKKQKILEEPSLDKILLKILEIIKIELEIAKAESKINKSIQEKVVKAQKDFYLNEQLKNIKKELGEDEDKDLKELKKRISKLKLSKEVSERCNAELSKLEKMNPLSSEYGVITNYLDWIASLPWNIKTKRVKDLDEAIKVLDKSHYGLDKIKDRILEYVAVQIKNKNSKSPILCLVGAPGVGKTSLAKSIADSLKRKYVKVSLGGVKDESEIRGHRRTYIGSMPGRIIQSMRKAKVNNPLMLLDEIDKIASDYRGDPAAALLEVLDPEQNSQFSDHYLEVEYDLSDVMFVATANSINEIPIPLRDRMEIIKLSGYTEKEKLEIAKRHLIKKQMDDAGLKDSEFSITEEAIYNLIRKYTFEAGVRNLNREIANLIRKTAKDIVTKKIKNKRITDKNLSEYAGIERFEYGIAKEKNQIGIATGLAYTPYGGDLLDIESLKFDGSGQIKITGKLGDVMKESANIALSYVRSIAPDYKIDPKKFNKFDFHIHAPEGATPKDGPSAGIAICLSLLSTISNTPLNKDVAMTGEVTLNGKVLKIGGLKEKLLAAVRGKIKKVLIPADNKKDLEDMPREVLDHIHIIPVNNIKEAIKEAMKF